MPRSQSARYPGKVKADYASLKRAGIPGSGDYHGPGSTVVTSGLRMATYRCPCGAENRGAFTVGLENKLPCRRCHRQTVQEREV